MCGREVVDRKGRIDLKVDGGSRYDGETKNRPQKSSIDFWILCHLTVVDSLLHIQELPATGPIYNSWLQ